MARCVFQELNGRLASKFILLVLLVQMSTDRILVVLRKIILKRGFVEVQVGTNGNDELRCLVELSRQKLNE